MGYLIIGIIVGTFAFFKFIREDGEDHVGMSVLFGIIWPLSIFIFLFLEIDYWLEKKLGGGL